MFLGLATAVFLIGIITCSDPSVTHLTGADVIESAQPRFWSLTQVSDTDDILEYRGRSSRGKTPYTGFRQCNAAEYIHYTVPSDTRSANILLDPICKKMYVYLTSPEQFSFVSTNTTQAVFSANSTVKKYTYTLTDSPLIADNPFGWSHGPNSYSSFTAFFNRAVQPKSLLLVCVDMDPRHYYFNYQVVPFSTNSTRPATINFNNIYSANFLFPITIEIQGKGSATLNLDSPPKNINHLDVIGTVNPSVAYKFLNSTYFYDPTLSNTTNATNIRWAFSTAKILFRNNATFPINVTLYVSSQYSGEVYRTDSSSLGLIFFILLMILFFGILFFLLLTLTIIWRCSKKETKEVMYASSEAEEPQSVQ